MITEKMVARCDHHNCRREEEDDNLYRLLKDLRSLGWWAPGGCEDELYCMDHREEHRHPFEVKNA